MNLEEYISSGILELYVLGQLSPEEEKDVQAMQAKHIEIQREIYDISIGLEKYGQLKAIKAPEKIKDKLFENLPPKTLIHNKTEKPDRDNPGLGWNLLTSLFALSALLGFTLFFLQKSENKQQIDQYTADLKVCDSIKTVANNQYAILNQINAPNNKIIDLTPTAGFANAAVYLHHNTVDKKNFLQLVNLPEISDDQSFQLWSLKADADPMPLNVFKDRNTIIAVDFIDKTATYAITIEPKGGSKSPSLDKLIGTMGVI